VEDADTYFKTLEWCCFKYHDEGYISLLSPTDMSVFLKSHGRTSIDDFYRAGGWKVFVNHFTHHHAALQIAELYHCDGIVSREAIEYFVLLETLSHIETLPDGPHKIRAYGFAELLSDMINGVPGHEERIDMIILNHAHYDDIIRLTMALIESATTTPPDAQSKIKIVAIR
jgi:hypothetical protein